MPDYGWPGETTAKFKGFGKGKGRGRRKSTKARKAKNPAAATAKPALPAAAAAATRTRGNSANAPGQRKKALGLKSAKTLAPGHTKRAAPVAANPIPAKAAASSITTRAPRMSRAEGTAKVRSMTGPAMPATPAVPAIAAAASRRRPPEKRTAPKRRGARGLGL